MLCGDGDVDASCGEQCDDGNTVGGDGCSATCQTESPLECSTVPRNDCRTPFIPGKATLMVKRGTTPDKDVIKWKWTKGRRTTVADFGDPRTTTDYRVCIYDAGGLKVKSTAPAGGLCSFKPCWKASGTSGFKYKDKQLTPEGALQLNLKQGADGKAQIQFAGKGMLLALPNLSSVTEPVRVQLRNSDGLCWEAVYSAPSIKHTSELYKDKAD
jgi:cysteine-rich repeat protein